MKTNSLFFSLILFFLVSCSNSDDNGGNTDDDTVITATFTLENAFPNLSFSRPVDFQTAKDGTARVFVVEQGGVIRVFDNASTTTNSEIFLDISARINTQADEQGLLGLAFHPNFNTNGYFYVNYTPNENLSVTSRFQVNPSSANVADSNSELILLEMPQPFTNHNGGQLAFGPDGYLYIASGDGGSGGDPQGNAQNKGNLLGAVLRIDVDNRENGLNYAIPPTNPFVGEPNSRQEIYAFGLRNPWRMSFDPDTGLLWSGDVGQGELEEINVIEAGGNYGWNFFEGTACFLGNCDETGLIPPVFEYNHDAGDKSITGGYVYQGTLAPSLEGKYVYGDFISGRIWALDAITNNPSNALVLETGLNIASFGINADDELYVCAFNGSIYRIVEN
ncbi:PQQ-dependent sugar dehydrogenase [Flagellimonas allohymeniacidonis]|uniref:Glucose sorbosone dehydrogenase n=1 Tax=Flagellimonas allohymeniacidonis TaxID=2517819 RepID=A0A4Q8QJ82_9FLAO|nr:PQQ-dependent sugar dehydrogenase [Allomuricauda hymeniacidonis]TAI48286.1 glucose sorbosone dehydrogenase [Allomuricauda hymeniacidonis]